MIVTKALTFLTLTLFQDSDTKEKGERSKEAGTSGEPVIPKKEGRGRKKGWKKETKVEKFNQ